MEERIQWAQKTFSAWKLFIELRKENSLPVAFDLHLSLAKGREGLLFLLWMCVLRECGKKAELDFTCEIRFC